MRQVFLDTETTGLSAEAGDRIIEIGCIEMVNRQRTGNDKHYYLNPERANSEGALQIHGLTDAFLADKPRFAEIAGDLLPYLAGAEVVAHNASFDVGFLDAELRRLARPLLREHVACVVDSLAMARNQYPGKSNSLDALCKRLEVDSSTRTVHGALLDAGLLAEVYIRMTRGQDSLVIEVDAGSGQAGGVAVIDFSAWPVLPVIVPPDEWVAHQALLAELDRASGGRALWQRLA